MENTLKDQLKSVAAGVALTYEIYQGSKNPPKPDHSLYWQITTRLCRALGRTYPKIGIHEVHRILLDLFEDTPFAEELKSRLSFSPKSQRSTKKKG